MAGETIDYFLREVCPTVAQQLRWPRNGTLPLRGEQNYESLVLISTVIHTFAAKPTPLEPPVPISLHTRMKKYSTPESES